ncbi:MAG TPA: helix-turn-helix domain-containing protein [Streptosporangiaceae bacterium]
MRVTTPAELGAYVRQRRRRLRLTQRELADRAGASRQWVVALEAGKGRAELGLVLSTLSALDLDLDLVERREPGMGPVDLDAILARHRGGR